MESALAITGFKCVTLPYFPREIDALTHSESFLTFDTSYSESRLICASRPKNYGWNETILFYKKD